MPLQTIPAGTSDFRLAVREETQFNVPAVGNFYALPITGETIEGVKDSRESPTITQGGESEGELTQSEGTSGGINAVLRSKVFDTLLKGVLWAPGWLGGVAAFPSGNPADVAIAVNSTRFEFTSAGTQLPIFAANDVIAVSGARNWNHVGLYGVANATTPTNASILALKLDGTAPFASVGAEPLRMVKVGVQGTFTITAAGGGLSATIDIISAPAATAAAAQGWIRLGGFANAGNNGVFRVTGAVGTTLTVVRDNKAGLFATETDNSSFWAVLEYAQNGNTRTSLTEEKYWDLASDLYQLYTGRVYSQLTLSAAVGQDVTLQFTGEGGRMTLPGAAQGTSYTAAPTSPESSNLDVSALLIGGTLIAHRSSSFQINKNARMVQEVGVSTGYQIAPGSLMASGTITAYTEDLAQMQRFLAESLHPIELAVNLRDGAGYVLQLPACRITRAGTPNQGRNTDTFTELSFASRRNTTPGYQARLYRALP